MVNPMATSFAVMRKSPDTPDAIVRRQDEETAHCDRVTGARDHDGGGEGQQAFRKLEARFEHLNGVGTAGPQGLEVEAS